MKILSPTTKKAKAIVNAIERNDKTLYDAYKKPSVAKIKAYADIYDEYYYEVYEQNSEPVDTLESKITICSYNTFQFTCGYKIVYIDTNNIGNVNIEYVFYTHNDVYKIYLTK